MTPLCSLSLSFQIQFVSLAICLSLSATVILLCLFAPKLYIVLFNPSKNTHSKFKTTVTSHNPRSNNRLDTLVATAVSDRQLRLTASERATEVTFCNSKSDVCTASSTSDQTMQTDHAKSSMANGTCADTEQQCIKPRVHETDDLLSPSKANYTQQTSPKANSSNLVLSSENPWKKISNVRYRLDGEKTNGTHPPKCQSTYAQHITFV